VQEDVIESVEGKFIELLRERQIPTKNDFQTLINRIEILSKKVEGYKLVDINGIEGQTIK
jgi:hypothetical protein